MSVYPLKEIKVKIRPVYQRRRDRSIMLAEEAEKTNLPSTDKPVIRTRRKGYYMPKHESEHYKEPVIGIEAGKFLNRKWSRKEEIARTYSKRDGYKDAKGNIIDDAPEAPDRQTPYQSIKTRTTIKEMNMRGMFPHVYRRNDILGRVAAQQTLFQTTLPMEPNRGGEYYDKKRRVDISGHNQIDPNYHAKGAIERGSPELRTDKEIISNTRNVVALPSHESRYNRADTEEYHHRIGKKMSEDGFNKVYPRPFNQAKEYSFDDMRESIKQQKQRKNYEQIVKEQPFRQQAPLEFGGDFSSRQQQTERDNIKSRGTIDTYFHNFDQGKHLAYRPEGNVSNKKRKREELSRDEIFKAKITDPVLRLRNSRGALAILIDNRS
jgi:hypothetical protein